MSRKISTDTLLFALDVQDFEVEKNSYGTKSEKGRIAWENMMTIMDTCRKHNVSFMEYVKDIFSKRYSMPRLSTLILEKARVNTTRY